jgi:tRNA(Ile)-lysidine synthase
VLLQQYLVMLAAQQVTGQRPEYDQVGRILDLTEGLTGSWVTLSDRYGVYRDRDTLVIRAMEEPADFRVHVLQDHWYDFRDFRFSSTLLSGKRPPLGEQGGVEYVDAEQIPPGHLVLRTWTEGDWFVPLGMKTKKKISDYFVDAKIPLYEKRKYPILETKDGSVIWLCGQRIDDRFRLTAQTVNILKIEFHRAANGQAPNNHRGQ